MVLMLPSPMWFDILDLGVAHLPMSWLGWKLAGRHGDRREAIAAGRITP